MLASFSCLFFFFSPFSFSRWTSELHFYPSREQLSILSFSEITHTKKLTGKSTVEASTQHVCSSCYEISLCGYSVNKGASPFTGCFVKSGHRDQTQDIPRISTTGDQYKADLTGLHVFPSCTVTKSEYRNPYYFFFFPKKQKTRFMRKSRNKTKARPNFLVRLNISTFFFFLNSRLISSQIVIVKIWGVKMYSAPSSTLFFRTILQFTPSFLLFP